MENKLPDLVIRALYAVNHIDHPTRWQYRRQDRAQCAFALKLTGKSTYIIDGQEYLSDPEHVVFLPQGVSYSLYMDGPGQCVMVEFNCVDDPPASASFIAGGHADTHALADALVYAWTARKPGYKQRCMALLYDWMARASRSGAAYTSADQQHKLMPASERMRARFAQESLTNDQLAALSGMSTVYFRKLFTRVYGVSPQKYLLRLRVRKAKELLMSEYASIEEVARAAGFSNVYHFDRMFRREAGMTPTEYARFHASIPKPTP